MKSLLCACALLLATVSALPLTVAGAALPPQVDVFSAGKDGYACFRIPALIALPGGALLLFAEGRLYSCADHGFVDLVVKSSSDGGATWSPLRVVHRESDASHNITIGNPAPVLLADGRILLPFSRNNKEAAVLISADGGATWAVGPALPVPAEWTWVATGPPASTQLADGRILIASDSGDARGYSSFAYISDDGGATWNISAGVRGGNECQIVEMPWAASLLLSMRAATGSMRLAAASTDGGTTWSAPWTTLTETECEASTIALPAHPGGPLLVMSSALDARARANMTLSTSVDSGHSWRSAVLVYGGGSAYSSLAAVGPADVALAFERDGYAAITVVAPIRI